MKLLLTSFGVANDSIHTTLTDLLGRPTPGAEADARRVTHFIDNTTGVTS